MTPPSQTLQFSKVPTAQDIFRARVFKEPLVLVGGDAAAAENAALAAALTAYHASGDRTAIAPLEQFLATHADSHWRASLLLNVSRLYHDSGAFSRALAAFDEAWRIAAPATDPHGRAVADLAVAEWLTLVGQFGQVALIEARLEQIGARPMTGSAAALVREARETATILTRYPNRVIASGPEAITQLLRTSGRTDVESLPALRQYVPTAAGTSLSEVAALARDVGMPLTPVYRDGAADLPVPSIMHWSLGHFSAVVARTATAYQIVDPALGGTRWIARDILLHEMSGYALLPGPLVAGWRDFTPQIPAFGNLGPRWTFDWLSYVEEVAWGGFANPPGENQCYAYVWIYHSGGWRDFHSGANGQGVFPAHPRTQAGWCGRARTPCATSGDCRMAAWTCMANPMARRLAPSRLSDRTP